MRRLAFAVLALALSAPAHAQIAGRHDWGPVGTADPFIGDSSLGCPGAGREVRDLRGEIRAGRESGQLSRAEARQLRRETRRFGSAARRYGRDGLSPTEARFLNGWALSLRSAVGAARLRAAASPPRRAGAEAAREGPRPI